MGCQRADGLPLRHRRAAGSAGDDDGLAHIGQGVLRPQSGRRAAEGADAGADVIGDTAFFQLVELLPHCAVNAGIPGVQAHGGLAGGLRLLDEGDDLFQRQFGAVVDLAAGLGIVQQRRIHQRPCVDHHVGLAQQLGAPDGNKVGSAAARSHKMYHCQSSFIRRSSLDAPFVSQR